MPMGAGSRTTRSRRWASTAPTRELAAFMVAEHLLLPDTATRRDLTDDDLILDVAAADRDAGTARGAVPPGARPTRAATGPAAVDPVAPQPSSGSSWPRSSASSTAGEMGTELAERLADADRPPPRSSRRRARSRGRALRPADAPRVLPERGSRAGRAPLRARSRPTSGRATCARRPRRVPRPGTYELLVVAADRPGLLSWIAGALALAGLSILTAQVFTTEDGVAVDLFEVEGAFEPEVEERALARVPYRSCARRSRAASRSSAGSRRSAGTTRRGATPPSRWPSTTTRRTSSP